MSEKALHIYAKTGAFGADCPFRNRAHKEYTLSMDTLMKADIFFFVTTIAVVTFLILGSVAFVYLIKILRNIKKASDLIGDKIETASENADVLYHKIQESLLFQLVFKKGPKKGGKKAE